MVMGEHEAFYYELGRSDEKILTKAAVIAAYNAGFKDAKDDACNILPEDDDETMAVFRNEYLTRIQL